MAKIQNNKKKPRLHYFGKRDRFVEISKPKEMNELQN